MKKIKYLNKILSDSMTQRLVKNYHDKVLKILDKLSPEKLNYMITQTLLNCNIKNSVFQFTMILQIKFYQV